MTVKQNSLDAYHRLNRHRVDSQIGRILQQIRVSPVPLNDRRLAVRTGLPVNVVESRLCQLQREGSIVLGECVFDGVTGNFSRTWRIQK